MGGWGVQGPSSGLWGLGFVWGFWGFLGFRVLGLGFSVQAQGSWGFGFRQGSVFRGFGCRVEG